jgi:hypothetical protein
MPRILCRFGIMWEMVDMRRSRMGRRAYGFIHFLVPSSESVLNLYSNVSLKIISKNIHVFTKNQHHVVMGTFENLFESFIVLH